MELHLFLIALFATTIGSISGTGGGIIIKPVMDAFSGLSLTHINFMSGCTVLSMSVVNFIKGRKEKVDLRLEVTFPLALGACLGGVLGKGWFQVLPNQGEAVQYGLLALIYGSISLYLANKDKIVPLQLTQKGISLFIGACLGMTSSFLGIGGGALNMAILCSLFHSPVKTAAKQSIFIIMFSQSSSILVSFVIGLPEQLPYLGLLLMMLGGCGGALLGSTISKKIPSQWVERLLAVTVAAMMCLNLYNMLVAFS